MVYRILIFYVGAISVMLCIFPWNQLGKSGSPFVTIFDKIGITGAANILNIVVLTAAVSAYNSGLYSNGRILYSLARQHNAPAILGRTNRFSSPYVGVLVSSAVTAGAVLLTYLFPDTVFLYVISVALISGIINWTMIIIIDMKFRKRIGPAGVAALEFKMPWHPVTGYMVLAFLAMVVVLMAFMPSYRIALFVGPIWLAVLFVAYWLTQRNRATHSEVANQG